MLSPVLLFLLCGLLGYEFESVTVSRFVDRAPLLFAENVFAQLLGAGVAEASALCDIKAHAVKLHAFYLAR